MKNSSVALENSRHAGARQFMVAVKRRRGQFLASFSMEAEGELERERERERNWRRNKLK